MEQLRIRSMKGLAWKLGVQLRDLKQVAGHIDRYYRSQHIGKKDGGSRRLDIPVGRLKKIQRGIHNLLSSLEWPEYLHGGLRGRSPQRVAANHLDQPILIQLDVKDFFPSITHKKIYSIWNVRMGCSPDVSRLLTRLTSYKRCLPQGAPSSCDLANLALSEEDVRIFEAATERGLRYDRYLDDLVFSGQSEDGIVSLVIAILRKSGFSVKRSKVQVTRNSEAQHVLGLIVNGATGPSVDRKYRDNVRAALFQARDISTSGNEGERRSLQGRIRHISKTNPGPCQRLESAFQRLT